MFLLYPTLTLVAGAFTDEAGGLTTAHVRTVTEPVYRDAFVRSLQLSALTAVAGAVLGALLAWAVVSGPPDGRLRRLVTAASGVLAPR